jgi:hypothetical protein
MILELNDEEILDFLMTSELEGDLSPKELKHLILKYRYFYRILHGKMERIKTDKDAEIDLLNNKVINMNNYITTLQIQNTDKENLINSLKTRKLSWKERFSGKIEYNT